MELNNNFGNKKKNYISLKDLLHQIILLTIIIIANIAVFLYKNGICPSVAAFVFRFLYKCNILLQNKPTVDGKNSSVVFFSTPKYPGKRGSKTFFMGKNISPIVDLKEDIWNDQNITEMSF